jgi:hypothetical protein
VTNRFNLIFVISLMAVLAPQLVSAAPQTGSQAVHRPLPPPGPVPRMSNGKPDLSGLWAHKEVSDMSKDSTNDKCPQGFGTGCTQKGPGGPLPYTEWGAQWMKNLNKDEFDVSAQCYPLGYTRNIGFRAPTQIVATPSVATFLFEHGTEYRIVYMDGRPHPKFEEANITWNGHSVGHWEGDTLVIDTVGPWWGVPWMLLDSAGHPVSDSLHLVERFRRIDSNTMEQELTVDDPKAYTKPWKNTRVWKLMPADQEIMGQICLENNIELKEHLINTAVPDKQKVLPGK